MMESLARSSESDFLPADKDLKKLTELENNANVIEVLKSNLLFDQDLLFLEQEYPTPEELTQTQLR